MRRFFALFVYSLFVATVASAADRKSLGKFTLAPGEKKTVSVETSVETKVGYETELSIDQAKTCLHNCVKMWISGKEDMYIASALGSSMTVAPVGGKIELVFENVEKFPVPMEAFRD